MSKARVDQQGYKQAIRYAQDLRQLYEHLQEASARNLALLTRMELILNSAGEGIYGLNAEGRMTFVNPAAARMTGFATTELLGRPAHQVLHHSRPDGSPYPVEACSIARSYREGTACQVDDEVFWRKDGTAFPVEYKATPILEDGRVTGAVVTFEDITERRQAQQRIAETMERLRGVDQQRQDLLAHLVRVQEEERKRIAGDIHDDSIQVMTATLMRIDLLRRHASADQRPIIDRLEETVSQAIGRLRQLMFDLRPPVLDREGLATALRLSFDKYWPEVATEIRVHDRLSQEPPPEIRALLHRIAQEALSNVRKHARARRVDVLLEERDGGVLVRVQDDGVGLVLGISDGPTTGHLGMVSMRERAELAGGWWRIRGARGQGTTVEFWVPVTMRDSRRLP